MTAHFPHTTTTDGRAHPATFGGRFHFPVEFIVAGRPVGCEFYVAPMDYDAVFVRAGEHAAAHGCDVDVYICGEREGQVTV